MNELHDDNPANFVRKQGIQSIKFKMWVELSSNFCYLSDIIRPPLRTNPLYEKPTVVFSPHAGVRGSHVHTRGPRLRRFAPSENVQKLLFCSLGKRFLCEYLQIYMLQSIKNIRSYAQYCIDLMFGVFTFTLTQFLAKTIFSRGYGARGGGTPI